MKTLFVLFINIMSCISSPGPGPASISQNKNPKGFAVVELFTSEGCSSCPPADEAVIDISNEYKKNVFVIGFHVDYWNYLGWKDVFSNASFTERQKQYAGVFNLNSIYTPQIVVNGEKEFVGSDKNRLHDAVSREIAKSSVSSITIDAKSSGDNKANINYTIKADKNEVLNIVLVQSHTQSDVKRGENSGRQLHHINIARDFKIINAGDSQGNISLTIPNGLAPKDCRIIAYLQNKQSLQISDAAEVEIN
ncbi:MAG: DUF1223 domain-containing protein [Bacteroidetes bacterium]|nr:DUF1223 domain-containing protein [Bacteroidota bacterium]